MSEPLGQEDDEPVADGFRTRVHLRQDRGEERSAGEDVGLDVAEVAGWLAQWLEGVADPEQKIARPRQIYAGAEERDYVPIERRTVDTKELVGAR